MAAVEEALNAAGNKVGAISIFANLGLAAWFGEVVEAWTLGDTAIIVSMFVSVMWCLKLWGDYKLSKLNYEIKMKEQPDKVDKHSN